jgi:hypothetical protein
MNKRSIEFGSSQKPFATVKESATIAVTRYCKPKWAIFLSKISFVLFNFNLNNLSLTGRKITDGMINWFSQPE